MNITLGHLQLNLCWFITLDCIQLQFAFQYLNLITLTWLQPPQPEIPGNIGSDLFDEILPPVGAHRDVLLRLLVHAVHGPV